jgi:cleavage and polyadenylation specificity factor subunit 5
MTGRRVLDVHPLGSYTFGTKRARGEKDATIANRMLRMKSAYEKEGKRRSVAAICLVNQHRTPHVLLLQVNATSFKLPGGKLRAAEGDIDGLKRKLRNKLQPDRDDGLERHEFDVGDQVATWFRTAFEPQMYPYLPAHITKPKEEHKMFVVQLPEKCYFAVPKNLKLLAVPVFELYGNPGKYGPEIASIPHLLSRYRLNLETAS